MKPAAIIRRTTDAFPALVTGLKAITRCERLSLALLDERRENALFIALDKPQVDLQQGSRLPVIATAAAADVLAGRAHLTPDLSLETHFPAEERLFAAGYRSRLNLPLRAGERVIGALNFAWRQTAGYDPAHLPLLTQIANAVALALEKDRLFDEARRRDAILGALATIGERLLAADDLSGVLPAVLARLGETTGVSRAFIFENHSEPSPLPLSLQPSPPTGSGGEVGGEGSVLLTDLRYEWTAPGQPSEMDDPRVHNMPYHASEFGRRRLETLGAGHVLHGLVRDFPEADRKVLGPRGVLAVVDVPIFSDGKWWGILGFDECARERVWSTAEIEALRSAAGALGAAFARQHSRQVEREQQALAEALRDTAAALNSTLKFEEVLDRILANVGRVVPHDAANIMLIEDGIARVVGCRGYAERGIEELVMAIRFRVADLPNLQHMVESGLPYAVPDTQAYEGWAELEETRWVRSYAGAPIRVKGEVIGFLNLDSAVPNFYTQALAERLAAFTDQAALAIENARLFEAERVGHGVTAALLDITQVAGSSLDLQHVLKVIAQRTAQACQAQRCTILMLDRAQQMLRPAMAQFADGHVERANWTRFKTSEPVALSDAPLLQALVRERAPMVWPDEKRGVTIPADWIQPYGVQKLLMVPLLGHDRVIGVLMLDLATADREFTPGQINLARAIGGQVASAIMNAESYATAEQRARESSTLARVGEALNRAMTAEETLQFVLAEAIKMVSRPEGSIILVERESEVLRMAANHGRSAEFVEAFNAQRLKPDLSTFAQSIGQGEMVEIADTTGDPRIAQLGIRNFPKQVTNVPLKTANGVLGVIVLNGLPHDDHARSFLRALADLAAAAIEKTHLLEESRRRAAQLEALRLASEQLTAQLELDVLLRHVLTILEKDFGYGATIFLVDSPTGELVWTVGTHPPGRAIQAKNLRLKIGEGISGRVAATGVPLLIQDTQAEPRYLADPSGPSRSAIAVPLKTGADTIGVLHVYRAAPHTLGYEDLRLLQTLGDQVAIALVNARLYAEVKQLAITDGLTGLPNHRHFFELADREFERARRYERPLSAIMVDIDHFKQVNDTYGHAVGNEVLRALAERCKGGPHSAGKLRDIDIMGRYGGDEFSIAVPENDLHSTQVLAERLQRYMADTPVPTQGGPLPITISLGLAERLEDCPDFHTMLNRADAAMYAARAGGRRNFLGW
ncbi:MAG: GAF domain-containing protein [Chloroflexi bacterium]|nr:GAF domain-containing protein [Chloroflexota bacterium]